MDLLASGMLENTIQALLETAFYPALLGVFVIASLGVPIPEDIPLILAGVILRTHPEIASWGPTLLVSAIGIMSGDLILYTAGRMWGDDVFSHRSVRWLITPARLRMMKRRFMKNGVWMVFFGRFIVGIRAVMCISAGVTRFPYWKFFLADFAGAALTIPIFIGLGYAFADMLPTLKTYLGNMQLILLGVGVLAIGGYIWYEIHRRAKLEAARVEAEYADEQQNEAPPVSSTPPVNPPSRKSEEKLVSN